MLRKTIRLIFKIMHEVPEERGESEYSMDLMNFSVKRDEYATARIPRARSPNPEDTIDLHLEPLTRKDVDLGGFNRSESQIDYDLILFNMRKDQPAKKNPSTSVKNSRGDRRGIKPQALSVVNESVELDCEYDDFEMSRRAPDLGPSVY